jgi:hypothetical protein
VLLDRSSLTRDEFDLSASNNLPAPLSAIPLSIELQIMEK